MTDTVTKALTKLLDRACYKSGGKYHCRQSCDKSNGKSLSKSGFKNPPKPKIQSQTVSLATSKSLRMIATP